MAEKKIKLTPKFDTTQLDAGGSFQHVQADGQAAQPQGFSQPPPAAASPGGEGQMPMPVGHVVQASSLTETERKSLESLGWKSGQAIPGNLPDLLAAAKEEAAASRAQSADVNSLPPPADPTQVPPLQMPDEVNIEDLSPEQQAHIAAALDEAEQIAQRGDRPMMPTDESVGQAAQGIVHRVVEMDQGPQVADDRASDTYASGEAKRAPLDDTSTENMTGDPNPGPKKCPHCDWDLRMPDDVEPTADDKQSFVQAILGSIPWVKETLLMDGQLSLLLRQLTPGEVDMVYTQVYAERDRGTITNQLDFWEQLTRYRTYLQLIELRSGDNLTTLPKSLAEWQENAGSVKDPKEPTILPRIADVVQAEVMGSETMQRVISTQVAWFNRLVAKLEANLNTPDFWAATKLPT